MFCIPLLLKNKTETPGLCVWMFLEIHNVTFSKLKDEVINGYIAHKISLVILFCILGF